MGYMGDSTPWRDRETLKAEYIIKDQTQHELAEKWGCRQETISKWVVRHDLRKSDFRPWNDEDTLRKMYYDEKMSTREIAEELGASQPTIRRSMEKLGIDRRDRSEAHQMSMWSKPAPFRSGPRGYEKWSTTINRKTVDMYVHRLLAVAEYGIDPVADKEVHHKNGIKWDNRAENIELKSKSEHLKTHAEKTDGYIGKNLHLYEG